MAASTNENDHLSTDDEDANTAAKPSASSSERKRLQNRIFDDWVRTQASDDAFVEPRAAHGGVDQDDASMTARSLMARQEGEEIIKHPRDYQMELFERAKTENLIAVLDTGTGKTLVAVLLIRWVLDQEAELRAAGQIPRVAFFLVPSVNLVLQQTAVLEANLAHSVGSFYGALGVDIWSKGDWTRLIHRHRVMVCTADILLHCLGRSFISIHQINLLVLDEAHHAKKDHSYARIIKDYYLAEPDKDRRPRVFGMTASPVDAKTDIAQAAARLETLLHSRIITTGGLTSLQSLRRPEERNVYYAVTPRPWQSELALDLAIRLKDLPRLQPVFENAKLAAQHLGSWCGDQYMLDILTQHGRRKLEIEVEKDYHGSISATDMADLDRLRVAYNAVLDHMQLNHQCKMIEPTPDLWSDKVSVLKRILDEEFANPTTNRCMVFVERKTTARLLKLLFQRIGSQNLQCDYLVGAGSNRLEEQKQTFKAQVLTLAGFRKGVTNCLFVTSVAEEGLDVPLCNLVIRFDLYRSMIQYVQSRGRARQNQSTFIHMLSRDDPTHYQRRQAVMLQELSMRAWCSALPEDRRLLGDANGLQEILSGESKRRTYTEKETGAKLTYNNSLDILTQFVSAIPRQSVDEPKYPTFVISSLGRQYVSEVILPADAPVRSAIGRICARKIVARRSAAFEICLELRRLNFLDTHFMPIYAKRLPAMRNALLAVNMNKTESYPMLTKPKIWKEGRRVLTDTLFMTLIEFPDGFEHQHTSLVMLSRVKMPQLPSFSLFRNDGVQTRVLVHIIPKPIDISGQELGDLTTFTLRIFEDVFSKTYAHRPEDLSYFLAPTSFDAAPSSFTKQDLDWALLNDVAQSVSDKWTPAAEPGTIIEKLLVDVWDDTRKYISYDIHPTLRPQDPVPADAVKCKWNGSILDYSVSLSKKHRNEAKWNDEQPVVIADKLNLRRNMLTPPPTKEIDNHTKAYLCPEPFRISALPIAVAVTSLAWPSIIWRLEGVLIAFEACTVLGIQCKPSLALAAITKEGHDKTREERDGHHKHDTHTGMGQNYERLEFLGDCFLKLATTLAVYVQNPDANEFTSHVDRMLLLCNKTLFETSKKLDLSQYIRSIPLSRRLWYPDGLQLLKGKGTKNGNDDTFSTQRHSLSEKTIADVSEALIGAAYFSHNLPLCWHHDQWENAIIAVTKLVGSEAHSMRNWQDYIAAYKSPAWQTRMPTASQREMATMIEESHNYRFKSPTVLRSAFMHGSQPTMWEKLPSYERMEFLGDALLDMVIISHLFYRFPDKDEQWLTEAKMAMVSNRFFGALACKLDFHKHIRHNDSSLEAAIRTYSTEVKDKQAELGCTRDYWLHVSSPPKCLADVVEAYVGAIFIDSGFDFREVQRFFDLHISWHFEDMSLYSGYVRGQPVTNFQHTLQNTYSCHRYEIMTRELPAVTRGDGKKVVVGVMVHNQVVAHSTGTSSRYARERAAGSALDVVQGLTIDNFRAKFNCDCAGQSKADESTEEHIFA